MKTCCQEQNIFRRPRGAGGGNGRRHRAFHAAQGTEALRQAAGRSGCGRAVIGELSAVVTVTDDGGSSGRLRREFNMLPPGDIRNCIVALSEDEALLSRLFQYRFPCGRGWRATISATCL